MVKFDNSNDLNTHDHEHYMSLVQSLIAQKKIENGHTFKSYILTRSEEHTSELQSR